MNAVDDAADAPSPGTQPPIQHLADGTLLFVLAWLWLAQRPSPPLHQDSSRDYAYARDLAEGAWLHLRGATANFRGLAQGSAWIDFLALCRLGELGPAAIEALITTLLALSVVLVWLGCVYVLPTARSASAQRLAPLSAGLAWLALLPLVSELPIDWQPVLLPLPIVFAHVAAWRVLRWGQLVDVLALAVLASLALDIHVVSGVFVLLALFVVPFAAERPALATPAFVVALAATAALLSPSAVEINARIAYEQHWWPAPVVALAAGAGARGLGARGWALRVQVLVGLELALALTLVLASLHPDMPELAGRYLAPFAPALALALAWLVARGPSPLGPGLGLGAALIGLALGHPARVIEDHRKLPTHPVWTTTELAPISAALVERGASWTELVLSLQGPDQVELLAYLASVVETGEAEVESPSAGLLVVAVDEAEAEAIRAELQHPRPPLVETPVRGGLAFLSETTARVDRQAAHLCTAAGACEPVRLTVTNRLFQVYLAAYIGEGDQPAAQWWREHAGPEAPELVWKLPFGPGDATVLSLPPELVDRCPWQIVGAEGIEVSEAFPSVALRLPEASEGFVFVARAWAKGDEGCLERAAFPPPLIETDPSWTQLRSLLEAER